MHHDPQIISNTTASPTFTYWVTYWASPSSTTSTTSTHCTITARVDPRLRWFTRGDRIGRVLGRFVYGWRWWR